MSVVTRKQKFGSGGYYACTYYPMVSGQIKDEEAYASLFLSGIYDEEVYGFHGM